MIYVVMLNYLNWLLVECNFCWKFFALPKKEVFVDITGLVEESSKQVELESKASWKVYNCAHVKLVDIAQGSTWIMVLLYHNNIALSLEEREEIFNLLSNLLVQL